MDHPDWWRTAPLFYYALLAVLLFGYFPPSEMAGTKDDVLQLDLQPAL